MPSYPPPIRALCGPRAAALIVAAVAALALAAPAAAASAVALSLPSSDAFAVLGHSCGGIREQSFATGFVAPGGTGAGDPTGAVYLRTVCSTGGPGSPPAVYTAWTTVTWRFTGAVLQYAATTTPPSVSPTFTQTDSHGDTVANHLQAVNIQPQDCTPDNTTYCTYTASLTAPPPAAPVNVSALQINDRFKVTWSPGDPAGPVLTGNVVTATPQGSSAPVLRTSASGTSTAAYVGPLEPSTTYAVTVRSVDAGGAGAASTPVIVTTPASTIPPGAPTGVTAHWTAPGASNDTLAVGWVAPTTGDSPIDLFEISAQPVDGDPPAPSAVDETVAGTARAVTLAITDAWSWSVTVRAHDAAGWGPWSAPTTVSGA